MSDQDDEVYLSAKHIREWKADYEASINEASVIAAQINELQAKHAQIASKIQGLKQKIHLAIPFSPGLGEWIQEQEFNSSGDNVTLTKAILKSLAQIPPGHPMPRQNIPMLVPRFGYPQQKLNSNPNYLYIALKRLTDRKLLEEMPGGNYKLTDVGRIESQKS
jgi:hypothetical protein